MVGRRRRRQAPGAPELHRPPAVADPLRGPDAASRSSCRPAATTSATSGPRWPSRPSFRRSTERDASPRIATGSRESIEAACLPTKPMIGSSEPPRVPASAGALLFDECGRLLVLEPDLQAPLDHPGGQLGGRTVKRPGRRVGAKPTKSAGSRSSAGGSSASTFVRPRIGVAPAGCGSSSICGVVGAEQRGDLAPGSGNLRVPVRPARRAVPELLDPPIRQRVVACAWPTAVCIWRTAARSSRCPADAGRNVRLGGDAIGTARRSHRTLLAGRCPTARSTSDLVYDQHFGNTGGRYRGRGWHAALDRASSPTTRGRSAGVRRREPLTPVG